MNSAKAAMDTDFSKDVEEGTLMEEHLVNTTVKNITWTGVTVTVKDRETKQPRTIVDDVSGIVEAGTYSPVK